MVFFQKDEADGVSEKRGQPIILGILESKNLIEMVDIELFEEYMYYNRIYFKSLEELDYVSLLQREILKRIWDLSKE